MVLTPSGVLPYVERGLSTIYVPGVGMGGNGKAGCKAAALDTLGRAHLTGHDPVVALRWPKRLCGRRVRVTHLKTGRATVARFLDRGPAGIMCNGTWTRARRLRLPDGCRWRGIADLTPAVATRIQHRGKDRVEVRLLP